ncbi:MAG: PilN domain-containing protein [Bdellovibrio sp.]|nr:PilN domain-containing protein [Bdellovibrio sp.]
MIKINLLKAFNTAGGVSDSYFSSDEERKKIYFNFAKRIAVVLIGPLALYIYENQTIPEMQQQLQTVEQQLSETRQFNESKKGLADEIKKYEQEQTKINLQMSFIDQVSKDKLNEFKLFQHLQRVTPETIWVNRLEFKGAELSISSETDVPADISKFLERLGSAEFLINVSPTNQDVRADAFGLGISTTTFTIKAQFNNVGSLQ